ncbi:aTP-dependent DNA helicase PcrA [Firmicutes bacterium CAG:882]|nr:aTP-dependent DNA helicase PcrA [Firmicutes bacterium CAG:882]
MSIYDTLNEQQRQGVLTTDGPVLLLAGAGSGKTRVLTHRVAYLIEEKDVNPYNILAITFTNKAAAEMRERVDRLVGIDAGGAWIMTFHAACIRILRRYIERIGYANGFTIYDTDDQKTIMRQVLKKLDLDPKLYKDRSVLSQISNAKDELISPDEFELAAGSDYHKRKIAEAYREYQKQLKSNNALDFDDIICKTVELFGSCPEVLDYYSERFRYIMVDEYQDTNTAQFKLISLLASRFRNLCVVGDDDQSIYKFRGANVKNILNFESVFPEAVVIKLEQNYRSTQNILDAANAVIKNNSERKAKSLWTDEGAGDKIAYNIYNTAYEEAYGIVSDIKEHAAESGAYNDYAVLYRTNAQSRSLEEKFIELGVPYRIYGAVNFYARKEIKDVLAYLKTIDNARDEVAVRRIINVPKRGIGLTTLEKASVFAEDNDISLYAAVARGSEIPSLSKAAAGKLDNFCMLISELRAKSRELSIKELISEIINDVKYEEYLADDDEPDEIADRMQNISELISKAAAYEETADMPTLSGFLEEVALVADIDNMDENNNIVSLMTLHSAKGLEFPCVYLAGMEDGTFPSYMAIQSDDKSDLEEERRLCYVGITRARKRLVLSMAKQRMIRGEMMLCKQSRFINEIPKELLLESGQGIRKPQSFSSEAAVRLAENAMRAGLPWNRPADRMSAVKKGAPQVAASEDELGYTKGDRVRHVKFGEGTVTNIAYGGRDFEVTVQFDTAGVKKMFASFAKLVKIG